MNHAEPALATTDRIRNDTSDSPSACRRIHTRTSVKRGLALYGNRPMHRVDEMPLHDPQGAEFVDPQARAKSLDAEDEAGDDRERDTERKYRPQY